MKKNESILDEPRKHWIIMAKPAAAGVLAVGGALIILHHNRDAGALSLCLALPALAYLAWKLAGRHLSVRAIANNRFVSEQGVITLSSSECPLDKIQNIEVIESTLGRELGYGQVHVQTAAKWSLTPGVLLQNSRLLMRSLESLSKRGTDSRPYEHPFSRMPEVRPCVERRLRIR